MKRILPPNVFNSTTPPSYFRFNATHWVSILGIFEYENTYFKKLKVFFYKLKTVHTHRGPLVDDEKIELIFINGKKATLGWDLDRWRWGDGSRFLEYTTNDGREYISSKSPSTTRAADKWQRYLPDNYRFYCLKCETHLGPVKRRFWCGPFDTCGRQQMEGEDCTNIYF